MLSLITGVGAKGQVGEAVALALARRGDHVLVVSRNRDEVLARTDDLRADGLKADGYPCDLSDAGAVTDLARTVAARHGARLDALVNLAGGFAPSGPLAESQPDTLRRMLQVNVDTAFFATRAFLPALTAASGSIVFFASDAALEGAKTSGVSAYVAAKAAVLALMRSVADEVRGSGVRANALAPASIRTATNEASMGSGVRYIEREDVAAVVAFLCSPAARAVTAQVLRLRR